MAASFPVTMGGADNVKLWANESEIEPAALNQLRNIAKLPPVGRVAVMPDVHLGKGATVGSVIAMHDAVCPAAVGVDIGCGVCGVRTSLTASNLPDSLAPLRSAVERVIPVGFRAHERAIDPAHLGLSTVALNALWKDEHSLHAEVGDGVIAKAHQQMGTLGGGNHFLELCLDDDDCVWLTLHSGSRNIGKELAERHIAVAKGLPHNADLLDRDLAFFVSGTPEMDAYLDDLTWAQRYAAHNRDAMLALFKQVMREFFEDVKFDDTHAVNVHHNYVSLETVDDQEFVVTRKGAIRAGRGDLALIPGSMGTGSYIVRGLGNPESLFSASHGAGRRMSRGAAKRAFTTDDLAEQTRGIECRKDAGAVDEIPGAYKDLDAVITAQSSLVEVVARLRTVMCVKG